MHERALNDKGFTCINSNTAGRLIIVKTLILCCSQHMFCPCLGTFLCNSTAAAMDSTVALSDPPGRVVAHGVEAHLCMLCIVRVDMYA